MRRGPVESTGRPTISPLNREPASTAGPGAQLAAKSGVAASSSGAKLEKASAFDGVDAGAAAADAPCEAAVVLPAGRVDGGEGSIEIGLAGWPGPLRASNASGALAPAGAATLFGALPGAAGTAFAGGVGAVETGGMSLDSLHGLPAPWRRRRRRLVADRRLTRRRCGSRRLGCRRQIHFRRLCRLIGRTVARSQFDRLLAVFRRFPRHAMAVDQVMNKPGIKLRPLIVKPLALVRTIRRPARPPSASAIRDRCAAALKPFFPGLSGAFRSAAASPSLRRRRIIRRDLIGRLEGVIFVGFRRGLRGVGAAHPSERTKGLRSRASAITQKAGHECPSRDGAPSHVGFLADEPNWNELQEGGGGEI